MATIWTTEGDTVMGRLEHRDFHALTKCRSGNAVFLAMSTQDLGTLFATGVIGDLFHVISASENSIQSVHDPLQTWPYFRSSLSAMSLARSTVGANSR